MGFEKKKSNSREAEELLAKVVFLDYVYKYCRGDKKFIQPNYFKEELKIEDSKMFEKKMIRDGYLVKKDDRLLSVTEKGMRFLEKNEDYIRFFNIAIPYISIEEYADYKKRAFKASFEEIMITLLLNKIKEFKGEDDYEAVKNLHYEIGKLYHSTALYDAQAMYHYLISLYFQVNGLEYYDLFIMFMLGKKNKQSLENEYDGIYIDPHLVVSIKEIGRVYYDDMADAVYEKNPISINMCPLNKFKELINDIINDMYDMEKWRGYFFSAFNGLIKTAEKNLNKPILKENK